MTATTPNMLTVRQAQELLRARRLSATELTASCLARIREVEPRLRALLAIDEDGAMAQAAEADGVLSSGEASPLTGIPYISKDVLCTRGLQTTCGSRILEGFVPPYDATVIRRLREQKAVLLGKSNMDEFAMGSSTEHSAFFPTANPWRLDCVPGGSSGGSAAAMAGAEALFTLGSDTGGSIRQPAGFCGVTGLKPTYGRVSRYGLIAFASSLDQVGPFTRTAADCAVVMNAIAGQCDMDATSNAAAVPDYLASLTGDVRGLRIGVPKEYFIDGMQDGVRNAVEDAIALLERLGASIDRTVSLPSTSYALAVYYIIAPSEASANLARYDGVKYGRSGDGRTAEEMLVAVRGAGFGPEVKRRIMLGTHALSSGYYDAYYLKAQKVRYLLSEEFRAAFRRYDVLVTPTSPTVAFPLGSRTDDPIQMYLSDILTLPVNIAGIPGLSIPCGFVDGLPVGLQLMADRFGEEVLLRVADAYQRNTDWHLQQPPL